jgi:biopolymer transport protein TolQ
MKELDLFEIILSSGLVLQSVLLLLIFFSFLTWALVIYYFRFLKKINLADDEFQNIYAKTVPDDLPGLEKLFKDTNHIEDSLLKIVYKNIFQDLIKLNKVLKKNGHDGINSYFSGSENQEFLQNSIAKSLGKVTSQLNYYKTYLASIATVAPFVGLFGTVIGIIDAFSALGLGGAGDISAIAPGIAEALVATAVGLFAAIPASWFFNHFTQKINLKREEIQTFSFDLLNFLQKSLIK